MADRFTSEARTEPPSDSRIAEARAQGHVPRAELAGLAAAFCVLTALLTTSVGRLGDLLRGLLAAPLREVAEGRMVPLDAQLFRALSQLAPLVVSALLACWFAIALARGLAQGFSFRIGPSSRPKRFARLQNTRWLSAPLAVLACLVALGASLPGLLRADPAGLSALLGAVAFRLSLVLALLGLIDAFLARTAWWRSLWMSRRERRHEEREAYGTPEQRAARERLRRELHAPSTGSAP